MIYARQNGKDRLTQRIQAANLALLSDAEFLRVVAKLFVGGGLVGEVASARLLSIAAACEAQDEASENDAYMTAMFERNEGAGHD